MLVRKSICCKTFQGGSWGGGGDYIYIYARASKNRVLFWYPYLLGAVIENIHVWGSSKPFV